MSWYFNQFDNTVILKELGVSGNIDFAGCGE
jgi:hypothetical protein